MTICPCCGFKSETIISHITGEGCLSCGARPVGEALPRPEHELPSFGRSLVLAVAGSLLVLIFIVETVSSFAEKVPTGKTAKETFYAAGAVAFDYVSWLSAAETAAWRLKWVMIPIALLVAFAGRKLYRSIVSAPAKFCGLGAARRGYIATAAIPLLVAILIGVTVPERLRHRAWGLEAGDHVRAYRIDRALIDYQKEFGSLPGDLTDLGRLADADGSLAIALQNLDTSGYKPGAELAAAPTKKPRALRGAVIMNASADAADDVPTERISFTNYELVMPGADKVLGTEDDLVMRDGVFVTAKPGETSKRLGNAAATRTSLKH